MKPGTSPKVSEGQTGFLVPIKSDDRHNSYMQVYCPEPKKKVKARQKSDVSSKNVDPYYILN